MPLPDPVPLFGIVLVGVLVSGLIVVHIWRVRIDRHRDAIIPRDRENSAIENSLVAESYCIRGRDVRCTFPSGRAPLPRFTGVDYEAATNFGDLDPGYLKFSVMGHIAAGGGGRGGGRSYYTTGGRDGAVDEEQYRNPLATPATNSNDYSIPNGAGDGTSSCAMHYGCDLPATTPEHRSHYKNNNNNTTTT
ncbi:hypothetical protein MPH_01401 [Macrophomina phaseolina MS6]|uniref:Uncharacterized protein n=1 Tax=Macrophomina phaseolina (strain MS6) TaxID=1126212 RepID=K2S2R3_MACPH|nr:hypothetical protein MPH_01401 [Macrophomina phaseolina MS6]